MVKDEESAQPLTDDTYQLWDYTADYKAHKVAYEWAVYAPGVPGLAGVVCWCVSRERAQLVCNALNAHAQIDQARALLGLE